MPDSPSAWLRSLAAEATPVAAIVLDPFAGSGSTCLVARKLGRRSVGVDLNRDYLEIAASRLAQLSLLAGDAA